MHECRCVISLVIATSFLFYCLLLGSSVKRKAGEDEDYCVNPFGAPRKKIKLKVKAIGEEQTHALNKVEGLRAQVRAGDLWCRHCSDRGKQNISDSNSGNTLVFGLYGTTFL